MRYPAMNKNEKYRVEVPQLSGGVNLIDLANLYSCSFVQTQDLGTLYTDGSFRIQGRISGSEIRGCNLLVQE